MSGSSLSSVVSGLVRASMGSSVPSTLPEDDVDRYVAELILKEAKQKAERYSAQGIRAYLPQPESNAPKTNKRFLSSIIRSTDDHNKTILRAQALAAQEVRMEREEEERRERKERAEEAVAAERVRRMMGRASAGWDSNWDHGKKREREREREKKKRDRSVDDDEEEEEERPRHPDRKRRRHHHRHRSHSSDRGDQRKDGELRSSERHSRDDHEYSGRRRRHRSRSSTRHDVDRGKRSSRDDDETRHRRSSRKHSRSPHRTRSRSPDTSRSHRKRRRRSPSPGGSALNHDREREKSPVKRSRVSSPSESDLREAELRSKLKAKASSSSQRALSPERPLSPSATPELESKPRSSPKDSTSSSQTAVDPLTPSRSPTPPPSHPPSNLPSKMDKYFAESYDPRLDVAPLAVPKIPATGLISDAEFEGWDAMLELIKLRREDKEEKKRMERLGISTKDLKGKDKKIVSDKWDSSGGAGSIMDIEYKKKGSVREWDMGKEGF